MSDTGSFELTPIFDGMTTDLPEDHAINWLDPGAVLNTDEDAGLIPDILHEEENDKEEENTTK